MHAAAHQFRSARTLPLQNHMKPVSQISRQLGSHRSEQTPTALRLKHPATDYYYHAAGGDFRAANDRLKPSSPSSARSFRELSNEFLGAEMKRDYLTEAFCFVIIVSVSAWPIVSMIRALSALMK
jgi:hypothetical protein